MKVTDVSFSYGEREIFRKASMEFEPGLNLIMGPSGCGKTTLLKILSGFFKDAQCNFSEPHKTRLLLLQEDALIPWFSGWENITYFLKGSFPGDMFLKNPKLLFLIETFIHKKAWQMSFGERRSIELVRAMILEPTLLLLDEPLNFVDPDRRKVLSEVLLDDNDTMVTLVSTHEPYDFTRRINKVHFFDGRFPVQGLALKRLQN